MKRRPMTWTIRATLAALPLAGCALDPGDYPGDPTGNDASTEEVSTLSQAAATYPSVNYWAPDIAVCFDAVDEQGAWRTWHSNDTARRAQAMEALEDTWGSVAGLSFTQVPGRCTAPSSSYLLIRLVNSDKSDSAYGTCGDGQGAVCHLAAGTNQPDIMFKTFVVHEVGHSLGFGHEHQRSVTSGGALVHERELCTHSNPPQNLKAIYEASLQGPNGPDANLRPESLNNMTPYDPCSVENYCKHQWGCVQEQNNYWDVEPKYLTQYPYLTEDNLQFMLTPYDVLAAEILYPKGNLDLGCAEGCFVTGSGALVRSDGRLQDSWSARGANPWWKTSPSSDRLTWWDPAGNSTTTSTYDPPAGTRTITFIGKTKYSGVTAGGTGIVTDDDSKWTALALSML